MPSRHIPDSGDIVWLDFEPQSGHEQKGRRPALVLSPAAYNKRAGLMVCCPMTTQIKGYPFEVLVEGTEGRRSVVLSDQVKSLDWQARNAVRKGRASDDELAEVLGKIKALLKN